MVHLRFFRRLVALALVSAAAGCGGDDLVLPSDGTPAQITAFKGDGQPGSTGLPLTDSIVAQVLDRDGRAIQGLEVVFELAEGGEGGTLSPDTVLTDGRGLAGASWTLGGTIGDQAVNARVRDEPLTVQFTASAASSGARKIGVADGNEQFAPVGTPLPEPLVVEVTDQFNNPVEGVEVSWSASEGEVTPASSTTGADGRAATTRILGGSTGQQSAEANVTGLDGSPVVFTHTATPGSPASLLLESGDDQDGPPNEELEDPLVVRLVDGSGNGIPDRAVNWIVATGEGSVTPETGNTDEEGFASARWTLGPVAGANTLNAVVSGIGVVAFSATSAGGGGGGGGGGTAGPSASSSSVSADPTSIQAVTGTATIRVTVRNAAGAPVSGATVALSASGSGNTLTQPSGTTGADGVAAGTLSSTVPGTKVVTATVNGSVVIRQTARVTVAVAPASRVELLEGDDQTAASGAAVPVRPAVRVTDALGLPVAGFGVTFVVTGGGGTVSGASQTTNSDGVARVGSWTLGSPGPNALEARAGSLEGSPVSFDATATQAAAQPHHFVFLVQPDDVEEDEAFSPAVTVAIVDAAGNRVALSGIQIQIDLLEQDGDTRNSLDGDRRRDTVDGIAVFEGLRVEREDEDYRLQASSRDFPALPPALSESFDVSGSSNGGD